MEDEIFGLSAALRSSCQAGKRFANGQVPLSPTKFCDLRVVFTMLTCCVVDVSFSRLEQEIAIKEKAEIAAKEAQAKSEEFQKALSGP